MLERLLEMLDQFTDLPNGVGKVRELVLRSAMAGRLVEQDSSFLSGAAVRSDIQLIRSKSSKPAKFECSFNELIRAGDDTDLPNAWERRAIAEVCDFKNGCHSEYTGN